MVPPTSTPAEFVPFAQDAPQPLSYPLVERCERRPVAVLEVFHPAPECVVEFFDDVLHRVGARPFGFWPGVLLSICPDSSCGASGSLARSDSPENRSLPAHWR